MRYQRKMWDLRFHVMVNTNTTLWCHRVAPYETGEAGLRAGKGEREGARNQGEHYFGRQEGGREKLMRD